MVQKIIAHRGMHCVDCTHDSHCINGNGIHYVENTMDSFRAIKNMKNVDMENNEYGIEFDIQMLDTGELVCFHDLTLDRLFNKNDKITELSYEEIKDMNVPKLSDILKEFNDTNILVDIEIKNYGLNYDTKDNICNKLKKEIEEHGSKCECIITSFDNVIINMCLKLGLRCGYISSNLTDTIIFDEMIKNGLHYLIIKKTIFDQSLLITYQNILEIMVFTFFNNIETFASDQKMISKNKSLKNLWLITDDVLKCKKSLS
jgi:glycerophosphoryl diester phosphodiesterase